MIRTSLISLKLDRADVAFDAAIVIAIVSQLAKLVSSRARKEHLAAAIDEWAAAQKRDMRMSGLAVVGQVAELGIDAQKVAGRGSRAAGPLQLAIRCRADRVVAV